MIEESERKAQAVIDLIRPLVEQQGLNLAKVAAGEQQLSADPATIEAAKAAIADGGEYSVEKTAERILGFARAMIGDDPSRMESIRAAVEKGFQEAQDMLGGNLSDISLKTRDAVKAEFDRWEKDGMPAD
jgi:predicted outer membrane protein